MGIGNADVAAEEHQHQLRGAPRLAPLLSPPFDTYAPVTR